MRMDKRLRSEIKLLDLLFEIQKKILTSVSKTKEAIEKESFPEAFKALNFALFATEQLENQVKFIMTHSMADIFQKQPEISQTLDEIRSKSDRALRSTQEFKINTKKLLKTIQKEVSPIGMSVRIKILEQLNKVLNSSIDIRLNEFYSCAQAAFVEHSAWQIRLSETKNELLYIYRKLELHPRIRKVSEDLFKNGHYRNAILDSFIEIENMTRKKSGIQETPSKLFAKVFNPTNPILRLNMMQDQTDRDEQEGFMQIFIGASKGIRNPKAHDTLIQKDPYRTLEYLCLASLLAKRVEESHLSPT